MTFNYPALGGLLVSSFREAIRGKIWNYLALGSFGTTVALLLFFKNLFEYTVEESIIAALKVVLVLLLIRFLLALSRATIKYLHSVYYSSLYGDAIILLNESFARVHAYRKTPGHQDEEFMETMITFCNNLKIIFDKLTASNCSVSIKVPVGNYKVEEGTRLVNLCRDIHHGGRDTKLYSETQHTLIGNSAFRYCFSKVIQGAADKAYLNSDISKENNYENTSFVCNENGILSYVSELVYPLVPILVQNNTNYHCHGFICIDSDSPNAFKTKYHVPLLQGVADGLYDLISERNQNKYNNE